MHKRFLFPLLTALGAPLALAASLHQPSIDSAFAQWRAEHGENWRMSVDGGTGQVEFLYGGSVAPAFEPLSEADWFTLARGALAQAQALHGIEQASLVEHSTLFLPLGMTGSSDKMTVRFRQMVGGVPVDSGFVNVLFSARGELLSIQTHALPEVLGLRVSPAFDADAAAAKGLTVFDLEERFPGSVAYEPELVVAQVEREESRSPALAWKVTVQYLPADSEPLGWTYYLDAQSGAVLQRESAIHYLDVGGTVYTRATPGSAPDIASNPETQQVMKYARVQSSAGTVFTDANGNFNFVGATGPLNCTFTYVGTYNQVNNSAGAAYSLVPSLTGTGNAVVLNPTPTDLVTAQANVFQSINVQRDWVRSINPLDNKADFVHTANANISSTCNAFFNGSSINFYQAGSGCVNTAFSTVVAHEDGHWLNVIYGTGNGSDGIGEGNADIWAMYIWDTPLVGEGFINGNPVRTGLNTSQFCGDCCSGCYGGVHADGEPLMGAAWKVRANLKTTHGVAAGGAVANALFLGWMNAYNQTQIKSVIETQWLTLDDNDGNINNGTPNFTDIDNGFRAQGFPGVTLIPLAISNVTQLPTQTNQAGPYVVNATISSNVSSTVTSATVFYRAGTIGAFQSVPMTNVSGGTWSGGIPGVVAPAKVQYYVQAGDNLSNVGRYPLNAPTSTLLFKVGAENVVFCDDFETNQGWTVANTSVTTGAWERGDPIGTLQGSSQAQPEFDNSPVGTQCYFTDQGTAGSANVGEADLDGGPTVLTSPAFDVAVGNAEIAYAFWMYNDDGDDSLTVQVSNNNGSTWVTARTYLGGGGTWINDAFDVAAFVVPTATVRVRFSVSDNPNNSITEAAIDDVCVSTLGPLGCTGNTAVYCSAKVNSQFCVPAIAFQGIPSASAAAPFTISASNVLNQKSGLLFYGYNTHAGSFQGGTLCVQGPLRRTPLQSTNGNAVGNDCTGTLTYDFNARIQSGIDTFLVAGQFVAAQYYYRDPQDTFTTGLTNAVSFTICP